MTISIFDMVENSVGKGEKCLLNAFHHPPFFSRTVLSKVFVLGVIKPDNRWPRVKVVCTVMCLTLYHTMRPSDAFEEKALLQTLLGKEKVLVISILSFSNNVFCPFKEKLLLLSQNEIIICNCFRFEQD